MAFPGDDPHEGELLRRAQAGDRDAFDALVSLHARMVLAVARRITAHREDAEDVAQEVFVRFYRALSKVDPARPVAPWLIRTTLNAAKSAVSRSPRRREDGLDAAPERAAEGASADPERPLRDGQFRACLDEAVLALSGREREVFTLRDVHGLEVEVIAAALNVSDVTVRRQSGDARRKVLAWFRKHHPEYVGPTAPAPAAAGAAGTSGSLSEKK